MHHPASDHDSELAAIAASGAIFSNLSDVEARRRVLSYVLARYLPEMSPASLPELVPSPTKPSEASPRELPGIAKLGDDGAFQITLRELAARSRLDAVVRLAVMAIHAHQLLTGRALSSRRFLTPLLKEWGLYDGNTRSRLARTPGIIRNRDDLSLDVQGRRDAERFLSETRSNADFDGSGHRFYRRGSQELRRPRVQAARGTTPAVFDHIENWGNFTNKCSVGIHTVNKDGIVLWANRTELQLLGYEPEEYIGRFIGDFHLDAEDVREVLGKLTRFETVSNFPARMRAKDGSTKFVMINSNVYRQAGGAFGHSRCFTTEISETVWRALKQQQTD